MEINARQLFFRFFLIKTEKLYTPTFSGIQRYILFTHSLIELNKQKSVVVSQFCCSQHGHFCMGILYFINIMRGIFIMKYLG